VASAETRAEPCAQYQAVAVWERNPEVRSPDLKLDGMAEIERRQRYRPPKAVRINPSHCISL
jgi:hypothetical protein